MKTALSRLVFPFAVATTGLAFLCMIIGLRGLITKKPFVLSTAWSTVPLIFLVLVASVSTPETQGGTVIALLSGVLIAFLALYLTRSVSLIYVAYGVTDTSLREGLLASLKKLDLPYEDASTGLRLPTLGADLHVRGPRSWLWWGGGSVKMKQRQFRAVLRDIAKGMNEYYRSGTAVEVSTRSFKGYLRIGVYLALLALLLALGDSW